MAEERQPDEVLRKKALEFFRTYHGSMRAIEFAIAFAQSIQAEARQEIEDLRRLAPKLETALARIEELKRVGQIVQRRAEDADIELRSAEQQLAEARAQHDDLGDEVHDHICVICRGQISLCDGKHCWGKYFVCIKCQDRAALEPK